MERQSRVILKRSKFCYSQVPAPSASPQHSSEGRIVENLIINDATDVVNQTCPTLESDDTVEELTPEACVNTPPMECHSEDVALPPGDSTGSRGGQDICATSMLSLVHSDINSNIMLPVAMGSSDD
ncbi:hypothetical protein V6N11_080536 [Hibiscus sabdariffa]|uniref:Uncharacterized protein n=1 Tax=Hibiscus sabdariffa TaxID=183260 RepID=A0ABR2R889_9ROSI